MTPTNSRGIALLQEVMDAINKDVETRAGRWNQGWWGKIRITKTQVENVDYLSPGAAVRIRSPWRNDRHFIIDNDAVRTDCGTAFCFAGHACLLAGDKFVAGINSTEIPHILQNGDANHHSFVTTVIPRRGKNPVHIPSRATKLLQLDHTTADLLFRGGNTLDELNEMVALIRENGSLESCSGCDEWVEHCECGNMA